jgi:Cu/Ag efflux protein CusF
MDGPEYGGQFDPYQVLLIQTNGTASVYQSYSKASKTTPTQATPAPATKDWAQGEIRRVDPANRRLTIKHGDIPSIDMPPMTMVFYVNDAQMLLGFSAGDKIEFQVVPDGKRYLITAIRKAGI